MTTILSIQGPLAKNSDLSIVGWQLPTNLTAQQWEQAGDILSKVEQSKQWWLGDWWNAGVKWGEGKEVCERVGIEYGTAANCGMVCKSFQFSRRREKLSFTHHLEVCAIDDQAVQDRMLDWCEEPIKDGKGKPRSTRELREQVQSYLNEQAWTEEEKARKRLCQEDGQTIVVNQKTDERLIRWAQFEGIFVKVDRTTDWGNPFELNKDGDRDYCCDCYATYLEMKTSLLHRLDELRGKVLGCWCHPERCHAHHLAEFANRKEAF